MLQSRIFNRKLQKVKGQKRRKNCAEIWKKKTEFNGKNKVNPGKECQTEKLFESNINFIS